MQGEKKEEPQQRIATIDIIADPKDKKIDDIEDPIVKAILSIPNVELKNIRSLKLSCNSYGPTVFDRIGKIIEGATNLQSIDISDCFMGRKKQEMDECIYSIFRPLWLRPIIEINISNNALGITGSKVFSQFLEKSQSLKRLLIANCGLGGTGSKEILNKVHNCTSLQLFSMGKNRIEIEGGLAIADSIKYLTKLKALFLFQNGIRKHAMENLLIAIYKHIQNLQILDISDNFAYGKAIPKLVEVIKKFKLRALNLSDCISKDDLKVIIEALKSHNPPVLEKLGLNYVDMKDKNLAEFLLKFLETCPLKYLEVQGTDMTKKSRLAFNERLKSKLGYTLEFVDREDDDAEVTNALGSLIFPSERDE